MTTSSSHTKNRQRQWWIALISALLALSLGVWLQTQPANRVFFPANHHNISSDTIQEQQQLQLQQEEECSCATTTTPPSSFASSLGLQGNVSDCCCSFVDIEEANRQVVHPLLQKVVETPFFAHFQLDLCTHCTLWDDAPLCILRDCGVCECDEPPFWAVDVDWMPQEVGPGASSYYEHLEEQVVTTVDHHVEEDWSVADSMSFLDQPSFLNDNNNDDDDSTSTNTHDNAVVVDLRLNPERYTGYSGLSAEKVWSAIHQENCFQQTSDDGVCSLTPSQRVYNRILSGLHSSISLHIAHSYCLEVDPDKQWECKTWGPNATLANERVLHHPDRLENLYVAFAMTLRAVQKAGTAVTAAVPTADQFFSDSLTEWTDSLLPELVRLEQKCPVTFDEGSLFPIEGDSNNDSNRVLELQRRFRHLQQIMECVGCDRCKLWGTLQTLGIGTALRVLLNEDEPLTLSRQEAVALVHTLERLSSSLVYASEFASSSQ